MSRKAFINRRLKAYQSDLTVQGCSLALDSPNALAFDKAWSYYLDKILEDPKRFSRSPHLIELCRYPELCIVLKEILLQSIRTETKAILGIAALAHTDTIIDAFDRISEHQEQQGQSLQNTRGTYAILFWNPSGRPITVRYRRGSAIVTIRITLAIYNGKTLTTFSQRWTDHDIKLNDGNNHQIVHEIGKYFEAYTSIAISSLPFLSNKPSTLTNNVGVDDVETNNIEADNVEFMATIAHIQECCCILFFASMIPDAKPKELYVSQVPDAPGLSRCAIQGLNASWPLFETVFVATPQWPAQNMRYIRSNPSVKTPQGWSEESMALLQPLIQ